jgi:hypothetical protein
MKNSKILVKLIGFNLLMLLFACGKEDSTTADGYVQGQKLVQIDSTTENGDKGTYLKIEYNQTGDLDNISNVADPVYYYYDKDNILNKSGIFTFGKDILLDITYGNNEIDFKFNDPLWSYSKKYIFNAEGYPIKCNNQYFSNNNYVNSYEWKNGNLVSIKTQYYDLVLEYDNKVNPFAMIYDKPFKNPQYLMFDYSPYYGNYINIVKYSKNNLKRVIDRNTSDEYLNISYQYNNGNLPIMAKYNYEDYNKTYEYKYE